MKSIHNIIIRKMEIKEEFYNIEDLCVLSNWFVSD
jgi:hypothetical protein